MIAKSLAVSGWSGFASRLSRWGRGPSTPGDHGPVGAGSVFTRWQRVALLAGFALLVILRLPHAWAQGRFLDEEGSIFFAYAWHRPAAEALLRSFGGYLNIGANGTTLLAARLVRAGYLPLEDAPYLTMVTALLFQLLPAVLILTGRARWLADRWAVLACLLILAVGPKTEEVFVNVLHIQFHLALCAALILALEIPRSLAARIGYGIMLVLAPLCGPGAIVLLPFFALRSLIDRDPARLAQTAVFAAGTALQMLLFFSPSPVRGHFLDPATLASIMFVRLAALPFCSASLANRLGRWIHASYSAGGIGWWGAVAGSLAYFSALIGLAIRDRKDAAIWLIVPGLAIGAASFGGGMIAADPREWFSVGSGERYNFLPLTLLSFGLVALAMRPGGRYRRVCVGLCLLTVILGAIAYPKPLKELSRGPAWSDEVAAWRRDHDHPLAVWPKAWSADLSDHDRPCSPPKLSGAAASDPSYCESVWLARVAPHMPKVTPGP
jgi:hypothetical protein